MKVEGFDLKFLFTACHAFYMHGEREEGIERGSSPNELPSAADLLRETHTHTHLIFLHQLDSFNISFTASCFSQIPLSSKSAGAFEDECDQNSGGGGVFKKKKKSPGLGAFGFEGA